MRAEHFIRSLAARVQALGGWRRRGAAFAAGSLSVLAMAPFFAWPVLWITLPVLVWLIDGAVAEGGTGWRPSLRAAEVGWWFGFGYFLFGLFWIGEAFLVEAEVFAVLLPVAVTLLPAGLALFFAAATGLASRLWKPGVEPRPGAGTGSVGNGMAARPCADRLSLERPRLRADLSAAPDAERGRARHLRPDAVRGGHLRTAAGAVE